MSHEIRTPLNGVMGFSQIARRKAVRSKLPSEFIDLMNKIQVSGEQLKQWINDVLDFTRIESGKVQPSYEKLVLKDFIQEFWPALELDGKNKGLKISSEFLFEPDFEFITDPLRLRQIITNLLSNAIKFTESGGITVTVKIGVVNKAFMLDVSVSDTGIGIPLEQQKKIFHAYEQLETVGNNVYKGSGLGLVITTQLVESMGGRIWVESEHGKGSCFSFSLPFELRSLTFVPSDVLHLLGCSLRPQLKRLEICGSFPWR